MKNCLILDWETTTSNKGNPFDITNNPVLLGLKFFDKEPKSIGSPFVGVHNQAKLKYIQQNIDNASIIVGFNLKFDLHWLRKIGIDISNIKVWDCQLAEFILSNQKQKYPSLDGAAEKYGFAKKLDIVKTEYWDKGINTDQIPLNILTDYLNQDLILTQQVFEKQYNIFKTDQRYKIFKLQCLDLLVLEEMEWNGIQFNTEKALEKAEDINKELNEITQELFGMVGNIPINFNSNHHISALLYGGIICVDSRIPVGVFKSGAKEGQVRYKIITKEYELPRLTNPIEGTETLASKKKTLDTGCPPSMWEVNDIVLRKLKLNKEAKKVVSLLQRYAELEKLRGTYLVGYTELIEKMNWPKNMLHGVLNQCVAVTGRLSSSKPNLQNADPTTKVFMESRYT